MDEKLFSTLIKNKKLCPENNLCESKKFDCVRFLLEKVSLLFGTVAKVPVASSIVIHFFLVDHVYDSA